jgi:hypothetical protein
MMGINFPSAGDIDLGRKTLSSCRTSAPSYGEKSVCVENAQISTAVFLSFIPLPRCDSIDPSSKIILAYEMHAIARSWIKHLGDQGLPFSWLGLVSLCFYQRPVLGMDIYRIVNQRAGSRRSNRKTVIFFKEDETIGFDSSVR